jgi:hypothetical protein
MDYIYKNPRPRLLVESTGGKKLGNCYDVSFFTVTSTFELNETSFAALFNTGAIGYGQESRIKSEAKFQDLVPCMGIEGDEVIENPVNPYSGNPYKPVNVPYWVYKIETFCDSGD